MNKISKEKQKEIQELEKKGLFIPKNHSCYGYVWYPRDVDVLFCPFQSCVRYKKGFAFRKERPKSETG
ncbi:MAG: hypothetical protein K2J71_06530 [Oscillospiraceae bacterium]|nr:hypothetical protein [Oscillospiraceae bacterium]